MDLNNIVGFKAVDKNGNERQVTVDEMTELVSARIVSAASEISTFAAAAAAGTDEFEDQLPQSDTFSWLRTLDGSKNPTLTSSSAAAKVLGELIGVVSESKNGLMSSNGFISRTGIIIPVGGTILNAMTNNMKDGIYQVTGISASDPMKDWGVLFITGAKFAIFKPLNVKNYVITITRTTTTSNWDTPCKFIGNL